MGIIERPFSKVLHKNICWGYKLESPWRGSTDRLFKLFSSVFYHCRFYTFFNFHPNSTDVTLFTMMYMYNAICPMLFDAASCY